MTCKVWLLSNYMQSLYSQQRVVNSECSQHRETRKMREQCRTQAAGKDLLQNQSRDIT